MTEILQVLNVLITSGVLLYVVKVEHRITRLETLIDHIDRK